jgi:hypothetical protein
MLALRHMLLRQSGLAPDGNGGGKTLVSGSLPLRQVSISRFASSRGPTQSIQKSSFQ